MPYPTYGELPLSVKKVENKEAMEAYAASDFTEATPEQLQEYSTPQQLELPLDYPNETILQEAQRLVYGDRRATYGHPLDDYNRTAQMWSAILGRPVTAHQAILCMAAVKISRQCNAPKRDNLTDLAGYAACAMLAQEEEKRRAARVA